MNGKDKIKPSEMLTLLGKGSDFHGKLQYKGTVRIDGKFTGEINTEDLLQIGDGALVKADIVCGTVIVEGQIIGTINATKKVELLPPGKIIGDISTPAIHIQEGAIFEGSCTMQKDRSKVEDAKIKKLT